MNFMKSSNAILPIAMFLAVGVAIGQEGESPKLVKSEKKVVETKVVDPLFEKLAAAQAEFKKGNRDVAIKLLKELVQASPEMADAQRLLGGALLQAGNSDDARKALAAAYALGRQTADVLSGLLRIDLEANRLEAALVTAKQLTQVYPGNLQARQALVTIYQRIGAHKEAMLHLRTIIAAKPDDADLLIALAGMTQQVEGADAALPLYEKAWLLGAKHVQLPQAVAGIYQARGDYGQAVEWLDRAIAAKADKLEDILLHKALLLEAKGDKDAARALVIDLLDREEPPGLEQLLGVLLRTADAQDKATEKLVARHRDQLGVPTLTLMAARAIRTRNYVAAKANYAVAADKGPLDAKDLVLYADVCLRLKDTDTAKAIVTQLVATVGMTTQVEGLLRRL
jgi:tetratricopeptide (TPR) repeat protein